MTRDIYICGPGGMLRYSIVYRFDHARNERSMLEPGGPKSGTCDYVETPVEVEQLITQRLYTLLKEASREQD